MQERRACLHSILDPQPVWLLLCAKCLRKPRYVFFFPWSLISFLDDFLIISKDHSSGLCLFLFISFSQRGVLTVTTYLVMYESDETHGKEEDSCRFCVDMQDIASCELIPLNKQGQPEKSPRSEERRVGKEVGRMLVSDNETRYQS